MVGDVNAWKVSDEGWIDDRRIGQSSDAVRGSRNQCPGELKGVPSGSVDTPIELNRYPAVTVWSGPAFAIGIELSVVIVTVSARFRQGRRSLSVGPRKCPVDLPGKSGSPPLAPSVPPCYLAVAKRTTIEKPADLHQGRPSRCHRVDHAAGRRRLVGARAAASGAEFCVLILRYRAHC
jgi:hypothetical protein